MKWKSFAVYVLCCFLLCNSVLADFESVVAGSDGGSESALGSVSVSSDSGSDSAVSALEPSAPVVPSEPAEPAEPAVSEGGLDEDFSVGEKVDEVVDKLPALGEPSVPEDSPGELPAEVSPGGNTVYVVGDVLNDGVVTADPVLTDVAITTGLAPVTPSDTTGVKAVLLSFIGNYDPPVVQYEYTTSNNYKQYVNDIQPDFVWICSFALIALFIYCLFKLGGGLLRG